MADKKETPLKELDEVAITDEKLVGSVDEKLTEIFDEDAGDDSDGSDGGDEEVKTDESSVEDETTPAKEEEEPAAESEKKEDESTSAPGKDAEKQDDAKEYKLPDAFVRCAVHNGWKPEEVTEFFQKDPEAALRTFGNIHATTNKLSQYWADAGRAKKTEEPARKESAIEYKPVDVAALKSTYEDDPIVDVVVKMDEMLQKVVKLVNDGAVAPKPTARPIDATHDRVAKENEVSAKIDNFFQGTGMKVYGDYYGSAKSWDKLTTTQTENRLAVLKEADAMISGAALQGERLSMEAAMEKAHMLRTSDMRDKHITAEIKRKVEKRGNSLSLKPSAGKKNAAQQDSGERKPKTSAEREAKVGAKLNAIFKEG